MPERQKFLFLYRPSDEAVDRVSRNGTIIEEWDEGTDNHELLFELDESLYNNDNLRDWLSEQTHKVNLDMVVQETRPNQTAEWIQSDRTVRDRLTIHDLVYDGQEEVADIISDISPGGDIRKYLTAHSLSRRFSIEFGLSRTRDITITGMDPLSMDGVQRFMDVGICDADVYKDQHPHYPSAQRILEWANRVDGAWGLECGAIGSISFPWKDRDIEAGFDGFCIFEADEEVKEWCDDRWSAVDSWAYREQLEYPWMYPDEYDLRFDTEEWCPHTAIRMWWD